MSEKGVEMPVSVGFGGCGGVNLRWSCGGVWCKGRSFSGVWCEGSGRRDVYIVVGAFYLVIVVREDSGGGVA